MLQQREVCRKAPFQAHQKFLVADDIRFVHLLPAWWTKPFVELMKAVFYIGISGKCKAGSVELSTGFGIVVVIETLENT